MATTVIRWIARVLGTLVFAFWGMFFVEHTIEWFIKPILNHSELPPLWVWGMQLVFFAMLIGFIIAFKFELIGAIVIILFAFIFFFSMRGHQWLLFFGITIIPALLYLYCWWMTRKQKIENQKVKVET